MKPPKPYSPFKRCKKCKTDYRHYNLSTTPCPRCEELKNELKDGRIEEHISKRLSGKYSKAPKSPTNGKIRSNYIGRNLRKLTSDRSESQKGMVSNRSEVDGQYFRERLGGKRQNSIPQVSKKQARINAAIASLKKARIERLGSFCEACELPGWCSYAHIAPKSVAKELQLDPEGAFLACETCDYRWEHFKEPEEVLKFKNLGVLLDFLWRKRKKRYYHVIGILKLEDKQLIASR